MHTTESLYQKMRMDLQRDAAGEIDGLRGGVLEVAILEKVSGTGSSAGGAGAGDATSAGKRRPSATSSDARTERTARAARLRSTAERGVAIPRTPADARNATPRDAGALPDTRAARTEVADVTIVTADIVEGGRRCGRKARRAVECAHDRRNRRIGERGPAPRGRHIGTPPGPSDRRRARRTLKRRVNSSRRKR